MKKLLYIIVSIALSIIANLKTFAKPILDDTTKAYSMPFLVRTPQNEVLLTWMEKDNAGKSSFCLAFSKDNGKTFEDKKVIYSGMGVSSSRLMRAKLLTKKDGSLVAVFSNRPETSTPGVGRRAAEIVYCVSKDKGNTWTTPQAVDNDPTKGIMRGFFDAVLMANDEVAVAYLKDVKNSTKHEERDLRLAITKNGIFQDEKLIDPVVCDCCNISMLLDANGALNIYYRDNNNDIRDIAKIISTDNAQTFSKPQILYNDNWQINGCPHNGATAGVFGNSSLIAWFSGTTNQPGIRLVTQEGKQLFVLDASAKNAYLSSANQDAALFWEQNQEGNISKIAYRKVSKDKVSETLLVNDSANGINPTGLVLDNQIVVAYEIKQANKKNTIKVESLSL
ncbi:MAG: sialidase family protein [Arcicella sp.]|nr:sialidase family protein [Arcicella sp.]